MGITITSKALQGIHIPRSAEIKGGPSQEPGNGLRKEPVQLRAQWMGGPRLLTFIVSPI